MNIDTNVILVDDDIDDVDLHSISCNCDECIDGLVLELTEERVA